MKRSDRDDRKAWHSSSPSSSTGSPPLPSTSSDPSFGYDQALQHWRATSTDFTPQQAPTDLTDLTIQEYSRMIAAAPELLAACRSALTLDSVSPDSEAVYNQLRAAISKATSG